jgi:hypothetical protein
LEIIMDGRALQRALNDAGWSLVVDGAIGPKTVSALREALSGPTARLTEADIVEVARVLGLTPAHVGAVYEVESNGRGMDSATGLPIILYEPHVFSRLTKRRFDARHSDLSYPRWGTNRYPSTQRARWDQMTRAVALDPGSALQSASWGLFQVMGFNHASAGYDSPWAFARAMAAGEREQLLAFGRFLGAEGLVPLLAARDWERFARRYNGPSYAEHGYDRRLASAYARRVSA